MTPFLPIISYFVDKNNVVSLANSNFCRVWRESNAFDAVAFLAILNNYYRVLNCKHYVIKYVDVNKLLSLQV